MRGGRKLGYQLMNTVFIRYLLLWKCQRSIFLCLYFIFTLQVLSLEHYSVMYVVIFNHQSEFMEISNNILLLKIHLLNLYHLVYQLNSLPLFHCAMCSLWSQCKLWLAKHLPKYSQHYNYEDLLFYVMS